MGGGRRAERVNPYGICQANAQEHHVATFVDPSQWHCSFSGAEALSQFFGSGGFQPVFFLVADLTVGANSVQFCLKWI